MPHRCFIAPATLTGSRIDAIGRVRMPLALALSDAIDPAGSALHHREPTLRPQQHVAAALLDNGHGLVTPSGAGAAAGASARRKRRAPAPRQGRPGSWPSIAA